MSFSGARRLFFRKLATQRSFFLHGFLMLMASRITLLIFASKSLH